MSSKQSSSLLRMTVVLGAICIISALLLAGGYVITADRIADAAMHAKVEAIQAVAPAFDNNPLGEAIEVPQRGGKKPLTFYPARKDGKLVGGAVESYSMDGFSGEIVVMYGFDADGKVTGYSVLSHAETPGLGAKMDEWFRSSTGHRSVVGSDPAVRKMTVAKDGGDIDAITAATITSRAFLGALRSAHATFIKERDKINKQ